MSGLFPLLSEPAARDLRRYGQKAALLAQAQALEAQAFEAQIPAGCVLDAEQAARVARAEPAALAALEAKLAELAQGTSCRWAVRASPCESLPGALLTALPIAGDGEALAQAVRAVLASNEGPAASAQRKARGRPATPPALPVLIQRFIAAQGEGAFGAVVFTRDPDRGEPGLVGEYLPGQGPEQVVAGKRIPHPLRLRQGTREREARPSLQRADPRAFDELTALAERLEQHFGEPLELELVRAGGCTWLLQVRPLVLSARALVALTLEAIDADAPVFRRHAERLLSLDLAGLVERELVLAEGTLPCLRGIAASPGIASGVLVTDPARALLRARQEPVVLFRSQASPDDVAAVRASAAVVTSSGGLTCHAAVIARGLKVPAVVGCGAVHLDESRALLHLRHESEQVLLREGDPVTVDAQRGLVYPGLHASRSRIVSPELRRLGQELRKLRPVPLWAYGPPELALEAKEQASLDGIVCPVSDAASVPKARGRECWLEVDAASAEALLPQLPPDWGVVVRGALDAIPFEGLRRVSRLRPLGVHLTELPHLPRATVALDLVLVPPGVGSLEQLSGLAPRLLFWADSAADAACLGHAPKTGVLCETLSSLQWVLRLVLLGPRPTLAP